MILYVFFDWLIRIGVPLTFPEDDQVKRSSLFIQLIKSSLEIVIVFLLVMFFVLHFKEKGNVEVAVQSSSVFSVFLLVTYMWNLVVLYIMGKLSMKDLYKGCINGRVFDLCGAEVYTKRFKDALSLSENTLKDTKGIREQMEVFVKHSKVVLKNSIGRSIAQLVSNHIVLFPIAVSLFIVLKRFLWSLRKYFLKK
ncbi:hypothetical protein BIU88_09715 [Chlorobaculum limnaeum]|uniref:Uncharacterized protein n=1 Tax=Chlorobaculum limnaeum TaxID=274537 RepID=A0A1D8CZM1_CHLLM|nr:hypothetical protein [Chlorobaculum limnaeum]AOS84382.1 hypothetical protein BIU88_09715 [Chlorobaculum limnaeum]